MNLRVAIIYNQENMEAQLIVENMLSQNIKPVGLITLKRAPSRRHYFPLLLQPKRDLKRVLSSVKNILCPALSQETEITLTKNAEEHKIDIFHVDNFNSNESARLLREIVRPELLILAGAPIIRQQILDVPKMGTLNAHPGYLPLFRGMDVIRWTIIKEGPLTVTLHLVDDGVDTGPILLRETIPFYLGDNIEILRKRATYIGAKIIVKGIKMISKGNYKIETQSKAEGRQYYRMSKEQAEEAEIKLQEKIAKEFNPKFDLV